MTNRLAEYSRAAASVYRVRQDSNKPAKFGRTSSALAALPIIQLSIDDVVLAVAVFTDRAGRFSLRPSK